jgi:hypothetical protein
MKLLKKMHLKGQSYEKVREITISDVSFGLN